MLWLNGGERAISGIPSSKAGTPKTVILLAALPFESEIIRKILPNQEHLIVADSGTGGMSCRDRLIRLLETYPGSKVILFGTAGAVNPSLEIGDVVIANQPFRWEISNKSKQKPVLGATTSKNFMLGDKMAKFDFRVLSGSIASWDEPIFNPEEKSYLKTLDADCVDMETGYGADVCKSRGTPFLAIRGISDLADDDMKNLTSHNLTKAVINASLIAILAFSHLMSRSSE